MLTRSSVHCAERIVATSNSNGFEWFSEHFAPGYARLSRRITSRVRVFSSSRLSRFAIRSSCSFQFSFLLGPGFDSHEDKESERQDYRSHQRQHQQLVPHSRQRRAREMLGSRTGVPYTEQLPASRQRVSRR